MDLSHIDGLRADLVPHRLWALSRWFYANPLWYYHRVSAAHEIDTDGKFYRLVDPELRELCKLLNDAGIRTTPSCQGHSYPRERFERIWIELLREQELIRGRGLEVRDSDNQDAYLFHNPDFRLPWESFGSFYREAAAHQNVGYVAMILPRSAGALVRRLAAEKYKTVCTTIAEDSELGPALGGSVFAVQVDAPDPQTRGIEWRNATDYIGVALGRTLEPTRPPGAEVPSAASEGSPATPGEPARSYTVAATCPDASAGTSSHGGIAAQ